MILSMNIFLFTKRKIELHTSKYVSTLQSIDLEQAPYKQKCAFIFFQGNILPFEHSVKERKVKRKTSLSKILGPFSPSCAFI